MTSLKLALLGECVIEVDGTPITPTSPHLFGLLLLLTLCADTRRSRAELQAYLFASNSGTQISHNLRQLLYRLRGMGLEFDETDSGLKLCNITIVHYTRLLRPLSVAMAETLTVEMTTFLPSYAPRLPASFLDWVDRERDGAQASVRQLLRTHMGEFAQKHIWPATLRLSELLRSLDPMDPEVVKTQAQTLAMLGRHREALVVLDEFSKEESPSSDVRRDLQHLASRIGKLPIDKREGTLRGRDSCLSFLDHEWSRAGASGCRYVGLVGHAGIGKTRVGDAFATRLQLTGARILKYTCDSESRSQPLALFAHILPTLRGMRGSLGAAPEFRHALARLRPTEGAPGFERAIDISSEALRSDLHAAIIDLLEAVSVEHKLLLAIDDAHWLDEASLSVIRALTTSQNSANLLVLLCLRPAHEQLPLSTTSSRGSVFILDPLQVEDSRAMLLELTAGRHCAPAYLDWCLEQGAGNPFFLHTLAAHATTASYKVPFDIRSLAFTSYTALSPASRNVLDSCLLLGRLATLPRVLDATALSHVELLRALRELEDYDLVEFEDGALKGPHALLHDALREFIPSSVAALLRRRIALMLEEECVADQYASPLAFASARNWIEAGEPTAATRLIQKCASHAAALGEPGSAIDLLTQVATDVLPAAMQAELLDDLIRFAQSGGAPAIAAQALRDRYRLATDLSESPEKLKQLELRIIEADLLSGGALYEAVPHLSKLLDDPLAAPSVRLRAAVRLMVIADQELDSALAFRVHDDMQHLRSAIDEGDSTLLRGELVFHVTFGDIRLAHVLAEHLIDAFPQPSVKEEAIHSRNFAAYALYRLRATEQAARLCASEFAYMKERGVSNQALYAASLRTEIALTNGDFESAREWHSSAQTVANGHAPHQLSPNSGLYANAGLIAMIEGRYEDAQELIFAPDRGFAILSAARYKAVSCAISVRLHQLQSREAVTERDVSDLEDLYERGRKLGGQDMIVEAIWCDRVLKGDVAGASRLLHEYLTEHRRETGPADWSLRHATGADEAWASHPE